MLISYYFYFLSVAGYPSSASTPVAGYPSSSSSSTPVAGYPSSGSATAIAGYPGAVAAHPSSGNDSRTHTQHSHVYAYRYKRTHTRTRTGSRSPFQQRRHSKVQRPPRVQALRALLLDTPLVLSACTRTHTYMHTHTHIQTNPAHMHTQMAAPLQNQAIRLVLSMATPLVVSMYA